MARDKRIGKLADICERMGNARRNDVGDLNGMIVRSCVDEENTSVECASTDKRGNTVFFVRQMVLGRTGRRHPEWATLHSIGRVIIKGRRVRFVAYQEFLDLMEREGGDFHDCRRAREIWVDFAPTRFTPGGQKP
jgi:hypothetical protein